MRAQDLGSTVARLQAGLTPGSHAANPDPNPTASAHVPVLLLALRGGGGPGSPAARASELPRADVPARGPPSPEAPARLRLGQGSRPSGGARTASRLPWMLGADRDPGFPSGGQSPAAGPEVDGLANNDRALGAGECTSDAGASAPACLAAACNLRTCSDDEDMEVRVYVQPCNLRICSNNEDMETRVCVLTLQPCARAPSMRTWRRASPPCCRPGGAAVVCWLRLRIHGLHNQLVL